MKKITARTIICFLLALLLLAGTLFFTFRFFTKGGQWVSFPSNRHLYTDGVLSRGRILDTEGSVLAAYDGGWQFHDSGSVRKATLHAVGDPAGVIGTGALTQFASKLTGYNPITGADTFFSGGKDLYLTIDADVCAAGPTMPSTAIRAPWAYTITRPERSSAWSARRLMIRQILLS